MNQQFGSGNEPQGYGNDWQQRDPRGEHGAQYQQSPPPPQGGRRGRKRNRSAVGPGQVAAAQVTSEERMSFIRRTYAWLTGAILLCVVMMGLFMNSPLFEPIMVQMVQMNWLIILGLFIGASWLGDAMALRVDSKMLQLIGFTVGVGAYAVMFTYLFVASGAFTPGYGVEASAIPQAGLLTLITFIALSAVVFITKQDFSILRVGLIVMSVLALGAIVAGVLFGFALGLGFAVIMVGFSAAIIIYQTSNILHYYPTDHHVPAALALFCSIGMLFWYIFMIFGFGD